MKASVIVLALIFVNPFLIQSTSAQEDWSFGHAYPNALINAVLPLPEDLRDGATVLVYHPDTGERIVVRQGSNAIVCIPGNPGDTRCFNQVMGPANDLRAKLQAEGKSNEEIAAALGAARESGAVPTAPYGTMMYLLRHNDNQIKLLWVMLVPNATPDSIGVSTTSQRDNALQGHGMPWLMREGTPGAHIMIPINNTPLSSGYVKQ